MKPQMTPRERAEAVAKWLYEEGQDMALCQFQIGAITAAVEADRADRTISDIHVCDAHSAHLVTVLGCVGVLSSWEESMQQDAKVAYKWMAERDEARADVATLTKWDERKTKRIAELEAALQEARQTIVWCQPSMPKWRDYEGQEQDPNGVHGVVAIIDAALSPAPAQPATAAKCPECKQLVGYPGVLHMQPCSLDSQSAPAARDDLSHLCPACKEPCVCDTGNDETPRQGGRVCEHECAESVISSNRDHENDCSTWIRAGADCDCGALLPGATKQ